MNVHAECLKDLQRFLRNDDSQAREAFFALGEFDIARKHLVPLITTYPDDQALVYNAREPPQPFQLCLPQRSVAAYCSVQKQ